MPSFIIEGDHRLSGEITPQGAKNEALQVLCATLLTTEPVRIDNLPDIADVNPQIALLREIGVKVTRTGRKSCPFQADSIDTGVLDSDEFLQRSGRLRGSVMLIGPLLARIGTAKVSRPGGDNIGRRRLDTHFLGIQKLGGTIQYDAARKVINVSASELRGCQHRDGCGAGKRKDHDIQCSVRTVCTTVVQDAQPHGGTHFRHRKQPAHH